MKDVKSILTAALSVLALMILPGSAFALDPKDISVVPAGVQAVVVYWNSITAADVYADGDIVNAGTPADIDINVEVFRYTYWGQAGSFPFAFSALLPAAQFKGGSSEVGDPIFSLVLWPFTKPETKTTAALATYATIPLGEYTNKTAYGLQPVCGNRWAFKEEAGFGQGFGSLPLELQISGFAEFYTDNKEAGIAEETLETAPLYNAEGHFIWDATKTLYLSADYAFQYGAEHKLGGVKQNDKTVSHTAGISWGWNLSPNTTVQFKYQNTLKTENGIKAETFGFRFAYLII